MNLGPYESAEIKIPVPSEMPMNGIAKLELEWDCMGCKGHYKKVVTIKVRAGCLTKPLLFACPSCTPGWRLKLIAIREAWWRVF